MDEPLGELVQSAHVVAVGVGRHGHERADELAVDDVAQRRQAEGRVDDQVPVPPPHVPDVASQQRVDVRLTDQRERVVDALTDEPRVGDGEVHRGGA